VFEAVARDAITPFHQRGVCDLPAVVADYPVVGVDPRSARESDPHLAVGLQDKDAVDFKRLAEDDVASAQNGGLAAWAPRGDADGHRL
jgi:hypothetical protein